MDMLTFFRGAWLKRTLNRSSLHNGTSNPAAYASWEEVETEKLPICAILTLFSPSKSILTQVADEPALIPDLNIRIHFKEPL